ncbi:hypothetical protein [Lacticaseibacillus camelliae]|uniref:hypothetical protein n=1 Tax=Lacticaseibacillus camelliae TaxID=381742 RepID=UPI0006CF6807|nr:hypothetical protein [Lacticaseibacillus camelliae]
MRSNRKGSRTQLWINLLLFVFGCLFSWFAWYVTQPQTPVAMTAALSFGFGTVILVGLLAYFDSATHTRWGRFFVDLGLGLAIVALLYVYLIGLVVMWQVIVAVVLVIAALAGLFALRKPNRAADRGPMPPDYFGEEEHDQSKSK